MGKPSLLAKDIPALTDSEKMINYPISVSGTEYRVTCVSVGNPHCVVFSKSIDGLDLKTLGPEFEHSPVFPERINTEFVRAGKQDNFAYESLGTRKRRNTCLREPGRARPLWRRLKTVFARKRPT